MVNLNTSNNTKYTIQIKSEEFDVPRPVGGVNLTYKPNPFYTESIMVTTNLQHLLNTK